MSSAYWLCVRRHASSTLVSYTERTRVRTLLFLIRASEWQICVLHLEESFPRAGTACSEIVFFFGLTSVSQLLRDWTDEAHVDPETEAEVLVLSIGTTKHRWLARTSPVFEQLYIKRFRRKDLHFSNAVPQPCVILKTNSQASVTQGLFDPMCAPTPDNLGGSIHALHCERLS